MSVILQEALGRWNEMRDDFELFRHAQYERAAADCRGELLNRRGQAEHVDPYSLFMGAWSRALAYASEELIEWWDRAEANRRWTVLEFERQWVEARLEEQIYLEMEVWRG